MNYSQLYAHHLKQAPWYQRPNPRCFIKGFATITCVALLALAFLSAYSLKHPTTPVGTIGHGALGASGLFAAKVGGFVSAPLAAIIALHLLRKTAFCLSDCIEEHRGFLYEVKDDEDLTRCYLFGTLPLYFHNADTLPMEVETKLSECGMLFVECEELLDTFARLGNRFLKSTDLAVVRFGKEHQIPIRSLDTSEACEKRYKGSLRDALAFNIACSSPGSSGWHTSTVCWQMGDAGTLAADFAAMSVPESGKRLAERCYQSASETWVGKIQNTHSAKPFFVAVDGAFLFDIGNGLSQGMITRLKNAGWTVEQVESKEEITA